MTTRRTFLGQGAAALALSLPLGRLRSSDIANESLPPIDEAELRAFALAAVDAARTAGATYADVRMTTGHFFEVGAGWGRQGSSPLVPTMRAPSMRFGTGIGVRALVDGAWGFSASDVVTPDTVAACGRAAAGFARKNRRASEPAITLAPGAATGTAEWATPITRDPFTVPIAEQGQLQLEAIAGVLRLTGLSDARSSFRWWRRTHVFASTEGAVLTQRFTHAYPEVVLGAFFSSASAGGRGEIAIDELDIGGYGWEAIHAARLPALVRRAAEDAIEDARRRAIRPVPTEVGRYDLVLSADAVSSLIDVTLAPALDLERAIGLRANRQGTSFVAPPLDMLGAYALAAPAVTLRADRTTRDGAATVRWDDEGVPAAATTLIEHGVVTDYLTSRETAGELAPWYTRRGQLARPKGFARAAGLVTPQVCPPNLTFEGPAAGPSLDEIIGSTKRGFYLETAGGGGDQQLFSNQFAVGTRSVRQIRDGKLGAPVGDFAVQFLTASFWKSLDALGGAASSRKSLSYGDTRYSGSDPHFPHSTIRAVPARFRQVNVLNTGRTA